MREIRHGGIQTNFPFVESKIAAIDEYTVYDVPRSMEKLARDIRNGEYGKVTDVVIAVRARDGNSFTVTGFQYGPSPADTAACMLDRVKRDILSYGR